MAKRAADTFIFTCEHGGNRVPRELAHAMKPLRGMLATHRGWDPGALELARQFSRRFDSLLYFSTLSRLVVDLNRSEHHPRVFSRVTGDLPSGDRERLLATHYRPFRAGVLERLEKLVGSGKQVIHVSVHSFTPVMNGVRRNADIGLLYDPRRVRECRFAAAWREAVGALEPGLRVRMNYPYRGTSDGHTTSLRGRFQPHAYAGIELEVNQAIVRSGGGKWRRTRDVLARALAVAAGCEPL